MEERIKEITGSFSSFNKERYHKSELLDEYLKLEEEIVKLTFNQKHAESSKLRLYNVWDHLEKMNERLGNPAEEELKAYNPYSKSLNNAIRAEISGRAGERKAFYKLESLRSKNVILKNIELGSTLCRTEVDAIVITEKGIFVIEVKNPHKDIFIDERGDYYKDGVYQKLDCHLGEKMSIKNILITEAVKTSFSKEINIINVIVFTNSNIQVHNTSDYLKTCFLSMLPHVIDNYKGSKIYSDAEIIEIDNAIRFSELHEAYPPDVDVDGLKEKFAILMSTLEKAAYDNTLKGKSSSGNIKESNKDVKEYKDSIQSEAERKSDKPLLMVLFTGVTSFLLGIIAPIIIDTFRRK